ncbi:NAD(P)/FAD-dependent oxidoreductase [Sporolactobacillus spathodeae]
MMPKKKIVILGAGYGGLRTLKKLQNMHPEAEIFIVNKNDYHCETTSLHEVAAGTAEAEQICYPIDSVIDLRQTQFIKDKVAAIDRPNKQVILEAHEALPYDYLLIALGFESETFGISGINEHALAISDIPSVEKIRKHIIHEFACWKKDRDDRHLSIVVGGAGFTSFEFLGEATNRMPELAQQMQIDPRKVRIFCIEPSPNVLPMFDRKLAQYASEQLSERGVAFVIGRVSRVRANEIYYKNGQEEQCLQAGTFIWTGGVRGSSVIDASGFQQTRGRVSVHEDLSVPGNQEILIIGDCSEMIDPSTGRPFPATAQIAMQQADIAAHNLNAMVNGEPLLPFRYKFKGTVCSLGKNDALGEVMGRKVKGLPAAFMKKVIDNRSLAKIGGLETMLKKGRFSFNK